MNNNSLVKVLRPSAVIGNNIQDSQRLHPIISCNRATSATFFNKEGKLVTASANVPRIEFDTLTGKCLGLRIDPTSTNYFLDSRVPAVVNTATVYDKWILTSDSIVSSDPSVLWLDGQAATRFSNSINFNLGYNFTNLSTHNEWRSLSFYMKGDGDVFTVTLKDYVNDVNMLVRRWTLVNDKWQVVESTSEQHPDVVRAYAKVQKVNEDGWYRVCLTYLAISDNANGKLQIRIRLKAGTQYVNGAQLENVPGWTSYKPTTTSTVTQANDNVHIPASALTAFVNKDITVCAKLNNEVITSNNHFSPISLYVDQNLRVRSLINYLSHSNFQMQLSGRLGSDTTKAVSLGNSQRNPLSHDIFNEVKTLKTAISIGASKDASIAFNGITSATTPNITGDFGDSVPNIYFGSFNGTSAAGTVVEKELAMIGHLSSFGIYGIKADERTLLALTLHDDDNTVIQSLNLIPSA